MLLTERKALMTIFDHLQQEKRELRSIYRSDLEKIEQRENDILNRLERLDGVDREAVDIEGVLTNLATTAGELSKLIPEVPVSDVVEYAAEILANEAKDKEITITGAAATAAAAQQEKEKVIEEAIKQETGKDKILYDDIDMKSNPFRRKLPETVLKAIYYTFKETNKKILTVRQIERKLKKDFNMQWKGKHGVNTAIYKVKQDYPAFLKQEGHGKYSIYPEFDIDDIEAAKMPIEEGKAETDGTQSTGSIQEAEATQGDGLDRDGGDRTDDEYNSGTNQHTIESGQVY